MPLGKRRGRGHDAWWDAWSGGRARWEWTLGLVPTLCVESNDVVVSVWWKKRNETWEVARRDKAKCLAREGYPAVLRWEQHVTSVLSNEAGGDCGARIHTSMCLHM